MKGLLRNTTLNAASLFFVSQVLPGLKIEGGLASHVLGGLALALLFYIVRPILNILSAPLNIVTLGFFSIFTNIIIFYLLTVFVGEITISAFTFNGFSFAGFVVPKIHLNTFFAFWSVSLVQSVFVSFTLWLFRYK